MSATNQGGASQPLLVVDINDIVHAERERLAGKLEWYEAYTADYTWEKTDIASVPGGAQAASRLILGGDVHAFCGCELTETTGLAAAQVRLLDGSAAGNEVILGVKIAQATTFIFPPSDHGVRVYTGRIFLQVVSGSVEGVIYWR